MMNVEQLRERVRIREKIERGETLTDAEKVIADAQKLGPKPCGCGWDCGLFLEPKVDGERPTIAGREVNPDCYYEVLGREIEAHPIRKPGSSRG